MLSLLERLPGTKGNRCKHFLAASTLFLLAAGAIYGQNGQIQGILVDPAGAAIAGGRIQVRDTAKGVVVKEVETGTDGNFNAQPLSPGNYSISAESSGMKKLERTGITLEVNQIYSLLALTTHPPVQSFRLRDQLSGGRRFWPEA